MASAYILYSKSGDKFYVGSCENLISRLEQHANKEYNNSYTALQASDWELFWSVDELEYRQARDIELHIKKMKSRKYFSDLKQYPEIIHRLKEKYK
jgi:putative endonuclease